MPINAREEGEFKVEEKVKVDNISHIHLFSLFLLIITMASCFYFEHLDQLYMNVHSILLVGIVMHEKEAQIYSAHCSTTTGN